MPTFPAAKLLDNVIGVDIHAVVGVPVTAYFGPIFLWHSPLFPLMDVTINGMPACSVGAMGYSVHIPQGIPVPQTPTNATYWTRYLTNVLMGFTLMTLTVIANLIIAVISANLPKADWSEKFVKEVTGIDTTNQAKMLDSISKSFSSLVAWQTWVKLLMPPMPYPGAQGSTAVGSPTVTVNGGPLAFMCPMVATSCTDIPFVPNAMTLGFTNVFVGMSMEDLIIGVTAAGARAQSNTASSVGYRVWRALGDVDRPGPGSGPLSDRRSIDMLAGRVSAGHPVDVASGVVYSDHEDISIPGQVDLAWKRYYSTALLDTPAPPTALGPGWTVAYFATLTREGAAYHFFAPEGWVDNFDDPKGAIEQGGIVRNLGTFQELTKDAERYVVTRWNVDTGEIQRFVFAEGKEGGAWRLSSIEDVTGQAIDLQWDDVGRLIEIRQRLERRVLNIEYTPTDRISSISLALPNGNNQLLVRYEYDDGGNLIAAFDALGHVDRYEYDGDSRMTREIVKDGGVYYFMYDEKGRCVKTSGLDRYDEKTFRYLDHIAWTEVTDSQGNVARYRLLASGQVGSIFDPLGAETKTEYDEHGRIMAEVRPAGATTTYEYDDRGNRSTIIDSLGNTFAASFNDAHQPLELLDPNGNAWQREYDFQRRLVATVDATGARWEIRHDEDGCPTVVTDPKGARRTDRYVNGVLVESTDYRGNVTRLESDHLGRVVKRVNPLGATLTISYDLLGNPIRVKLPDGNIIEASYDNGSNLSRVVDSRGYITRYRYGSCRRLLQRIDQNGNSVKYIWGTEPGRLEQAINENGEAYTFHYDAAGRVTKETSFDNREYSFQYDPDGWCTAVTNGNGEVIEIQRRNPEGRILEQQLPDGGFTKYTYDKLGCVIEATNQDVALTMELDPAGRVLQETQGDYWVQLGYDAVGNRTHMKTSLGHFIDYELDANGDATRITTTNDRVVEFQWDAVQREILRSLPGDVSLSQHYDVAGRLIEQRVGPREAARTRPTDGRTIPDATLIRRFYTRDPSGAPVQIDDDHWGTTHYTYDPAAQLVQAVNPLVRESFEHDFPGNITRSESVGGIDADETLTYGPGNRLIRNGDTIYEYDAQGRLVSKERETSSNKPEVWTFTWDSLDQLRSVTRPDGQVWEYKYDAFGRRVEKKGPEEATRFVWDGDVLAHEIDLTTNHWTSWIFSPESFAPLAKTEGNEFYSIITDHLGTPREMIDNGGRVVWRRSSRAYGGDLTVEQDGVDTLIRFPGQYYDEESGLCCNRFRYYDQECGRFIQQDPLGLAVSSNFYRYAPNPITWIDPLGLAKCHDSGERGRQKAKRDLKRAGYEIVEEEVTMIVGGQRVRADFMARKNGRLYVFEVKNGTGGLTDNQTASGVFNIGNPANQNGGIRTSGGRAPPGTRTQFVVDTNNKGTVGNKGDTGTATFAVLKYDGRSGSRHE